MHNQCNIHLLLGRETNSSMVIEVCKKQLSDLNIGHLSYTPRLMHSKEYFDTANLYITDDSEIRKGDLFIDTESNTVEKWIMGYPFPHEFYDNCKKIIATTDTSLIINKGKSGIPWDEYLPQIPKQFIEYYISEYNAGRKIEQVDVEFEGELYGGVYAIPKIYANNEISIKPVEEKMYSREEVVELIKDFTMSTHQLILNKNPQRHEIINTWFKENLK